LLDVSKLAAAGWRSTIDLHQGIKRTVKWYRENAGRLWG
jgi:GDP-L-fucose synthase